MKIKIFEPGRLIASAYISMGFLTAIRSPDRESMSEIWIIHAGHPVAAVELPEILILFLFRIPISDESSYCWRLKLPPNPQHASAPDISLKQYWELVWIRALGSLDTPKVFLRWQGSWYVMGDRFTSFYCFTLFQPCNQSQKLVDIQGFFRQSSGLGFDISPAVREHHRPDFFLWWTCRWHRT